MARSFPSRIFLLALLIAGAARADSGTLASLIADGAAADTARALAWTNGIVVAKNALPAASAWVLRPGDAVDGPARPQSARITLYGEETPQGREVLCAALVKYFPRDGGWQPYFRLDDEMLFVRQKDWVVPFVNSEPKIALGMGDLMPNIEGYYPFLRFTGVERPIAIEAWSVEINTPTTPSPLFPR